MNCPHCRKRANIYTSYEVNETMREMYLQCTNLVCGYSWLATMEAVRTISPASPFTENPNINLPMSSQAELKRFNQIINQTEEDQIEIFEMLGDDDEKSQHHY